MAEFVQQSMEEMLPELEQMERVGLFTKAETRQILKKRKNFEYKLRRRTKCKEDFLQYIQYEINVLALVKKRRERTGYTFKKADIDIAIVQRIHKLFRLAEFRFQDDVTLWLSHIEFSKSRNEKASVSRLFTRMLQIHNRKPDLWILAAKWEFEDNLNPDNARLLMQRALRFNKDSKKLYLEYYRLELLYAEKMKRRKEILGVTIPGEDEIQDAVLEGAVARVVYKQALDVFGEDVDFLLSMLPICHLFEFAQDQEKQIYTDLEEHHSDSPVAWNALARRHLQVEEHEEIVQVDREARFHQVFHEGVQKLQSDEIWSLYLKACLELAHQEAPSSLREKRLHRALQVFEEAADADHLTEELWEDWLEILLNEGLVDKAVEVVQVATTCHRKSVPLWRRHLDILISSDQAPKDVLETFNEAQQHVSMKESWSLWELVLQYCISLNSGETETLLERAVTCCREVCGPAKILYLELTYLNRGIAHARDLYHRLSQLQPVPAEFYRRYITMEMSQSEVKAKKIRHALEDALREYGEHHPDLWIDFIKFETSHPKGKPANAGTLHFRAVKTLEGSSNQEFLTKYTLLQTRCSS